MDIAVAWAVIIAFCLVMYSIFDGFDLGVGILIPWFHEDTDRSRMINTIAPVWDGNETWIVLAGVGLFGGFPLAYSILLPALYFPIVVMIVCLILRGVAMEFRFTSVLHRKKWDVVFSLGSTIASFAQGMIIGSLLQGVEVNGKTFSGTPLDFISPFTLLNGLTAVCIHALVGATWLDLKTEGLLQWKARRMGRLLVVAMVGITAVFFILLSSLPSKQTLLTSLSASMTTKIFGLVMLLLVLGGLLMAFLKLRNGPDGHAMIWTMLVMSFGAISFVYLLWPNIVPPHVSIYKAAAPAYGHTILLIGSIIVIPVILSYLLYSYKVFKGKVNAQFEMRKVIDPSTRQPRMLGVVMRQEIKLPLFVRLLIPIVGFLFLTAVIGPFGEVIANISLIVFILVFLFFIVRRNETA
jgi:cytochrome bd ubiquinol oxidase subunit II